MTLVTLRAAPAARGWVEVWQVGTGGRKSGALDLAAKTVRLKRVHRVQLDADGTVTVELLPTAALTPAGTVYLADFVGGANNQESLVFAGFTGAGPVEATDYIVDVPGALLPAASAVAIAAEAAARAAADAAHAGAADPHPGYTTAAELSAAVTAAVGALVDGAPGALDTLNELAAALGDDANFAATVTAALAALPDTYERQDHALATFVSFDKANSTAPFDVTEFNVERLRAVHTTPLTLPTAEGPNGQTVHPDVVVFAKPWNGYRYWMAMTPYPNGVDTTENPHILASNDNVTWVEPAGIVNPIDAPAVGFYPDPTLFFYDGKLWCLYAANKFKTSTDGVTWSARQTITVGGSYGTGLSPSVARYDGLFYLWHVDTGVDPNVLQMRTSVSGTDPAAYGTPTACILNGGPDAATRDIWHVSMRPVAGGFVGAFAYCDRGISGANAALHLATSMDGETWKVGVTPLLRPDPANPNFDSGVYRACLVPTDGRGDVLARLWYSGVSKTNKWRSAYTDVRASGPESLPELARLDVPNTLQSQTVNGNSRNRINNPTLLRPAGSAPHGWANNMAGATGYTWDVVSESWSLVLNTASSRNITQNRTDLALVAGDWWTLSFEAQAEAGGAFRPQITFKDAGNAILSTATPGTIRSAGAFRGTSVAAQVPAGATQVDLLIVGVSDTINPTRYWFRRAQFEKSATPTTWAPGAALTVRAPEAGAAVEVLGPLTAAGGAPLLASSTKNGDWVAGSPARLISAAGDSLVSGEVVPRRDRLTNIVSPTSGTLCLTYFTADKDETINTLTAWTGSVAAAAAPTLCRMGIYSEAANGDITLVASTPNDTALFAATNTAYAKALSAPFPKVLGRRYATALLVVSGVAMPNFHGLQLNATAVTSVIVRLSPAIIGRVTGQTDLPASVAAASVIGFQAMIGMQLS